MDLLDVLVTDPASLEKVIETISPEQLEFCISKIPLSQISAVLHTIGKRFQGLGKKKTRAAILGMNERLQLEMAAQGLSLEQLRFLVDNLLQPEDKHHWKLAPLLMGMPVELFSAFLFSATEKQLHLLQQEAVTEPVQHQLSLLLHELSHQTQTIEKEVDLFCEELRQVDPELFDRASAADLYFKMDLFVECFDKLFQSASRALAVAWNTNRLDLIEGLNKLKDMSQKYSLYGIGACRNRKVPPTGLYAEVENRLFRKLGNPEDISDREALRDDDPAIEGLAKLAIWDVPDYWEAGLLPRVKNIKNLDIHSSEYTPDQRNILQERLQCEVQENLAKLGLKTVLDLKLAFIFSKGTLKEYIHKQVTS